MFKPLQNSRPFLKMALEGFAGDGKTFTATKVAIGLHRHIGSKKPIAFFDTEKASKALVGILRDAGIEAVVADSERSLRALNEAIKWCEAGNADILIIDSITHVWEEFLRAYMADKRRSRLEFQDWGVIKPRWKYEFSNPFVNAQVHILFTGRAGFEYSDEKNEETGKREIFKSGIKMKAETETAFEPDLLVLMEKEMQLLGEKKTVKRVATILKDRTDKIDGQRFVNPSFEDFAPAILALLDGTAKPAASSTILDTFEDADPEGRRMEGKRKREKSVSQIEGAFALMGLGQATQHKQLKSAILKTVFDGVLAIEKLDDLSPAKVEGGAKIIAAFATKYNEYLDDRQRSGEAPENDDIKRILTETIDEHRAATEAATAG